MNKITHQIQLRVIYIVVFLLSLCHCHSQEIPPNKYGLRVITSTVQLQKTCQLAPGKQMVDLKKRIPGLVLDLRYAGPDNFMHKALYPSLGNSFLRQAAAEALALVQEALKAQGYGLKIFDAYRPYSVTEAMWEAVKDDRYAADPRKGSGHNRGIAVDLTLIRLDTKLELDMGTGFDNFSDTAHQDFQQLPAAVLQNRQLLKTTMEQFGFRALATEWWHYYLPDSDNFELLDISFEALHKLKKPGS